MTSNIYQVPKEFARKTWIDQQTYERMYAESVNQPEKFWAARAEEFLLWDEPWQQVYEADFKQGYCKWFSGGKLNASVNCLDRHLATKGDNTAIIWEADSPGNSRYITYNEIFDQVCRLANVIKECGVTKGDRVCIYMPMIPEAAYAMLACARVGAIHSVVFGGFSAKALHERIVDADCSLVITADEGLRGGKIIPLKEQVNIALEGYSKVKNVITVRHTGNSVGWDDKRDIWFHDAVKNTSALCEATPMDAEDPLFILYTSGSTGKPKGVLHTTGGYLLHATMSHRYIFDYHDGDIFWCAADVGWVTGHSYIVYGPLSNGATEIMFEGLPVYPTPARCWEIIDKYEVNCFYTAPTAIRTLMGLGDHYPQQCSRRSLNLLGTVGEPINPEAWEWYYRVVGEERCPVVDTWWQTETGAALITPLPGATALKPGSATKPFFGVQPALLDDDGEVLEGEASGHLVITGSWPGQIRTVYGDHQRCIDTYFTKFPGYYTTGDGARRDADGYFWITGRVDDVINVSGHRLGSSEIESALVLHPAVAEAAVIAIPHPTKGQGIHAFVTLMQNLSPSEELYTELIKHIDNEISPIARPERIYWAPALPKTRSGKIMRRILRRIASGEIDDLGDTTTLADPSVVDILIKNASTP